MNRKSLLVRRAGTSLAVIAMATSLSGLGVGRASTADVPDGDVAPSTTVTHTQPLPDSRSFFLAVTIDRQRHVLVDGAKRVNQSISLTANAESPITASVAPTGLASCFDFDERITLNLGNSAGDLAFGYTFQEVDNQTGVVSDPRFVGLGTTGIQSGTDPVEVVIEACSG